uniref:UDENN domain-containing protein n=1 Tax=Arcella intermedia TaxID=1963864 RepID=A0A6B2L0S0_9EUKA
MFPKMEFQDKETSNLCFLSFPETTGDVGDTIYTFRLKRQRDQNKKRKTNKYLYGFVFFRQEKDSSISRGYLQKSVVLVSPHPYINLFTKVIGIVGPMYFEKGEFVFEAANRNISAWPPHISAIPSLLEGPKSELDLPFLGHILDLTSGISLKNQRLNGDGMLEISPFTMHVSLYSTFSAIVSKLWTLWELVILCEPILIISPSPQKSSDAVLALISLIHPLNYSGDFRPYFTIHDPDYNVFVDVCRGENQKNGKPEKSVSGDRSYIIGVTNPIFKKEFAHWPHVIILDEDAKKSGKKSSKTLVNAVNTKYKPLRTIDDEHSKILKKSPGTNLATAVNNELLRRCMDEVTLRFMAPLVEHYPKSYLPEKREYHPFKNPPPLAPFKEEDFLKHLLKVGTKTKDIELYRRFIRTPNFVSWFRSKKRVGEQEIIRTYINNMDPKKITPLLQGKSEVDIVDLWIRGNERKTALIKKEELANDLIAKYDTFLEALLGFLPEDIRKNMRLAPSKKFSTPAKTEKQPQTEEPASPRNAINLSEYKPEPEEPEADPSTPLVNSEETKIT